MCLTGFVLNPDPGEGGYHLILAFNRDEFYDRPTKPAEFWQRNSNILGGQDMFAGKEGGTWLGMSQSGRLAMLLNISQPDGLNPDAKGRGFLVSDFLEGSMDGQTYLKGLTKECHSYNGFNLITVELGKNGNLEANYYTNCAPKEMDPVKLNAGVHTFSNHTRDTLWPKTDRVRTEMEKIVGEAHSFSKEEITAKLFEIMTHDKPLVSKTDISTAAFADAGLTDSKILEKLRELVFVKSTTYGTRTTTVILIDATGNVSFTERTLKEPIDAAHPEWEQQNHTFSLH